MKLLVILCAVGLAVGEPSLLVPGAVTTQYHAQDELGQYSYGYAGGPSAKTETRTLDGVTRGGYSYLDGHGLVQSAAYVSDPLNGFRVAATNLPVGPAVPATPELHLAAPGVLAPGLLGAPGAVATRVLTPTSDTVTVNTLGVHSGLVHPLLRRRRSLVAPLALGVYPWANPWVNTVAVAGHDTPAVTAAKVSHLVSHAATAARDVWGGLGGSAVLPVGTLAGDTPAVASAKIAHAAAHVDANLRLAHGHLWRKKRSALLGLVAPVSTQFHAQDALGQYNYGYSDGLSAKQEVRGVDGSTVGAYSYVDSHGLVQSVNYAADANGFRVAATNLPHTTTAHLVHAAPYAGIHYI